MDLFDFAIKNERPITADPVPQGTKAPVKIAAPVVREKSDKPFIDSDGGLVIPFGCDSKYHWWAGGQSVEDTLKEIAGD